MEVNFSAFITLHYISTLVGNQTEKVAIVSCTSDFNDSQQTMLIPVLNFQEEWACGFQ